jgi:hypothetical protein
MVIAKIPTKKEAEIIEKKKKKEQEDQRKLDNKIALGVNKGGEPKKLTKR